MTLDEARDEALKGIPKGRRLWSLEVVRNDTIITMMVTHVPDGSATISNCKTFTRSFKK